MMPSQPTRVRRSLVELQNDHAAGNPKPLDDLMRAWMGIKALTFDDPRSFFNLGGYHGEPFRGAGWGDSAYWGGYCNHGNVLFPTWHRVYCLKVEEALQSIAGCADVMLPYWDEMAPESLQNGIPACLTDEFYTFADGSNVNNPLRSFTFPVRVADHITSDNNVYTKPAGYETVRYPLSGLVGTADDQAKTDAHNSQYPDPVQNADLLNKNVVSWMQHRFKNGQLLPIGISWEFEQCLNAPNYTVFSNTTSAQEWNDTTGHEKQVVVPLEQPHNDIHLAVGGFDVPGSGPDFSPIAGANGDMGENDTAALDPIFYFHHCNIDRVFWLWQQRNQAQDKLDIIEFYPGTNTSDNQGPTPGLAPNTWLSLDTPLNPFKKTEGDHERPYTSRDCFNIETQLGYTYSPGSLAAEPEMMLAKAPETSGRTLHVSRINKAPLRGSFIVAAYRNSAEGKELIGYKTVLSRWDSGSCINCQTHLEVKAAFHIPAPAPAAGLLAAAPETVDNYSVDLITRDHNQPNAHLLAARLVEKPYRLEIR